MKIDIEVKEVLSRVISVDAETVDYAIAQVEDMYFKEIVLDYVDLDGNAKTEELRTI
jgi:hypothetical protein